MQKQTIQTKTCRHCNSNFEVTDKDLEFYSKVSPIFDWKKYEIPAPKLCPDCRQQRRLSFRNERNLYRRKCEAIGKSIISVHSPNKDYKVYDYDFWWSDQWDPISYWKDFDFNKNFFEQFNNLFKSVPLSSKIWTNNERSEFTHLSSYNKDCYLLFNWSYNENVMYSYRVQRNSHGLDLCSTADTELCYENIDSKWNFKSFYIINSRDCRDSLFLRNCLNCEECILSYNLVWKKYYILNKQYSEDEYKLKKEEIFQDLNKYKNIYIDNIVSWKILVKQLEIENSENCVWNYIEDSSNCNQCFDVKRSEDCKFCYNAFELKDSMDVCFFGFSSELIYNSTNIWLKSHKVLFSCYLYNCQNVLYSYDCHNSSNLFWCIWLRDKQYCIFNKQYSKDEYDRKVIQIIESMKNTWEWGELFPSYISPFGYNETIAQRYFPLPHPWTPSPKETIWKTFFTFSPPSTLKEEGARGWGQFNWSNYESPSPNVEKIIPASKLPENIKEIPDDILNWAIKCELTEKSFRIIKQEIEFYRKYNLPIPRKHPDQRHSERMELRTSRKLFDRKCEKCWLDIKTAYSLDRPEIVYCEKCYNDEVY